MNIQQLALQGKHNIYNSMASAIAGRIFDLRKDVIRESLIDFKNVEHRLERVIRYTELSISTTQKQPMLIQLGMRLKA